MIKNKKGYAQSLIVSIIIVITLSIMFFSLRFSNQKTSDYKQFLTNQNKHIENRNEKEALMGSIKNILINQPIETFEDENIYRKLTPQPEGFQSSPNDGIDIVTMDQFIGLLDLEKEGEVIIVSDYSAKFNDMEQNIIHAGDAIIEGELEETEDTNNKEDKQKKIPFAKNGERKKIVIAGFYFKPGKTFINNDELQDTDNLFTLIKYDNNKNLVEEKYGVYKNNKHIFNVIKNGKDIYFEKDSLSDLNIDKVKP